MIYRLLLCFCLLSCQRSEKVPEAVLFSGNVMTIDYRIIVADPLTPQDKKKIERAMELTFTEIDTIFNKWNPRSELSLLNDLKAGVRVPLSPQLHAFLQKTAEIVLLTEGLFDPTVLPLHDLWKNKLDGGDVPTAEEIAAVVPVVGWDKIHFDAGIFYKDADLTALDLGGIAKGHCVDLLVERLNAAGFHHIFVDWGGEIRATGVRSEARPWRLLIRGLDGTASDGSVAHLNIRDMAIATSGDYLQNWTVADGETETTYCHIIHPKLCCPLVATESSIASASVMAQSCAVADGLATALMMFPTAEQGSAWIDSLQGKIAPLDSWLISRSEWNENFKRTVQEEDEKPL